jgi:hypothetical protein
MAWGNLGEGLIAFCWNHGTDWDKHCESCWSMRYWNKVNGIKTNIHRLTKDKRTKEQRIPSRHRDR